jgi:hypothetical protein
MKGSQSRTLPCGQSPVKSVPSQNGIRHPGLIYVDLPGSMGEVSSAPAPYHRATILELGRSGSLMGRRYFLGTCPVIHARTHTHTPGETSQGVYSHYSPPIPVLCTPF